MENSFDFRIVRVHLSRNSRNKVRCYPCVQGYHCSYGIENHMDMISVELSTYLLSGSSSSVCV